MIKFFLIAYILITGTDIVVKVEREVKTMDECYAQADELKADDRVKMIACERRVEDEEEYIQAIIEGGAYVSDAPLRF